jgi:hypothetical protein
LQKLQRQLVASMNSIFVANNVDTSLPLSPNFKTISPNSNFDVNIIFIVQLQNSISPFSGQLYPMHKLALNSTLGHKNGLGEKIYRSFAFANILFQYNSSFEFRNSFVPCLLGANINFKVVPWTSKTSSMLDVSFHFLFYVD